jgi:hypothetical protein
MIKNITRLIMIIIVLVIIYNVYNITVEKLTQEQIYTFELEKEMKSDVISVDKDKTVQIYENKINYVELPPGVYNSYKLGISKTFHPMKDSKGMNQTLGDPLKSIIISVSSTNKKKIIPTTMTFSLESKL